MLWDGFISRSDPCPHRGLLHRKTPPALTGCTRGRSAKAGLNPQCFANPPLYSCHLPPRPYSARSAHASTFWFMETAFAVQILCSSSSNTARSRPNLSTVFRIVSQATIDEKYILKESYLNCDNLEESSLICYLSEQKNCTLPGFHRKTKMSTGRASKTIYKYKSTFSPCEPESPKG